VLIDRFSRFHFPAAFASFLVIFCTLPSFWRILNAPKQQMARLGQALNNAK